MLRDAPPAMLRLARWSLYCVVAVVLTFGAATAYAQLVLEPIEARTDALTNNALPSIVQLTRARDDLVRIQSALDTHGPADEADIEGARRDLDAAMTAYLLLPDFPNEQVVSAKAAASIARLDRHLERALASEDSSREELTPLIRDANDGLSHLETFNIHHGLDQAHQIQALKRRSRVIALILSALSLLVACIASWFVWRAARRQAQLAVEHEALLVNRATELEAFAGRIAHDLKDPLGTLALRLALIRAERGEGEHVDKAVNQLERIDRMIEGLLTYARASANPPPNARAPLHDVIDDVVEQLRPGARVADVALRIDAVPTREVACTSGALRGVLSSLLTNAIQWAVQSRKPRSVVLHVDDQRDHVRVEVSGPGVPDTERRAFLSVGLATVKRIIESYGGHFGVRSALDRQSVLWFDLPTAKGSS